MSLATTRLEKLQRKLELALNQQWPRLDKTQRRLVKLPTTRIQPRQRPTATQPTPWIVATQARHLRLLVR
jgi:hypothetical protein